MVSSLPPNHWITERAQRHENRLNEKIASISERSDVKAELQRVSEAAGYDDTRKNEFNKIVYSHMARGGYSLEDAETLAARSLAEKYFDDKVFIAKLDEVFKLGIGSDARFVSHTSGVQAASHSEGKNRFYDAAMQTQLDEGVPLNEAKKNAVQATALIFFEDMNKEFMNTYGLGNSSFSSLEEMKQRDVENNVIGNDVEYGEYGIEFELYMPRSGAEGIRNYIEQMYSKYSFIMDNPDTAQKQFGEMVDRMESYGFKERSTFDGYMEEAKQMFDIASLAHKIIQNYPVFEKLDIRG